MRSIHQKNEQHFLAVRNSNDTEQTLREELARLIFEQQKWKMARSFYAQTIDQEYKAFQVAGLQFPVVSDHQEDEVAQTILKYEEMANKFLSSNNQ